MNNVEIKTLPAARLARLRVTGPYGSPAIAQGWERFGNWCGERGLMQPRRIMLGISQDNPFTTPPEQCRYDCCVVVDDAFKPQGQEIAVQAFAGGRYACSPFKGRATEIGPAWMQLCGVWLPRSGLQAENRPVLEVYDETFEMDPATGVFNCWLCVPVRSE